MSKSIERVASHNPGAKIVTVEENDNGQIPENGEAEQMDDAIKEAYAGDYRRFGL